jgi:hypothetical protein
MIKSVSFIAVLIISLCASTDGSLTEFSNTIEGKRVLLNIQLQSKLTPSGHLNIAEVRKVISYSIGRLDVLRGRYMKIDKVLQDNCENSINELAAIANEAYGIFLGHSRRLENAKNEVFVLTKAEKRAESELINYKQLQGYVTKNLENWEAYWNQTKETLAQVIRIVDDIRHHLTTHVTESAFIQMGNKYHIGLTQIKISLAGINTDYSEMKPIISNLVEIMQDQPQLSKAAVRLGLKGLFHKISEYVSEKRDEIAEEDSQIRALFSVLQKAVQDNIYRAESTVNVVKEDFTFLNSKVESFTSFFERAENIANLAHHILEDKGNQCKNYQQLESHARITHSKIEYIVSHLQEVLRVDGANIESFLQNQLKVMKN